MNVTVHTRWSCSCDRRVETTPVLDHTTPVPFYEDDATDPFVSARLVMERVVGR